MYDDYVAGGIFVPLGDVGISDTILLRTYVVLMGEYNAE